MNWIVMAVGASQILLLAYAASTDVVSRLIPDQISIALVITGIAGQAVTSPFDLIPSFVIATVLFLVLLLAHARGWIGGGDVKLLVALAIGLSLPQLMRFLFITAMAGGVLAAVHLVMRRLPYPTSPPVGSSILRRVYAVERWRHLRRAPLPYGLAIACGGIWTIIDKGA
jgi:prepilin peptidase CpaA